MQRKKLGLSKEQIHARVMEAAKMLGIEEYMKRKPKRALRRAAAVPRGGWGGRLCGNPKAFLF